jgi:predicted metal-dependent hydrolase
MSAPKIDPEYIDAGKFIVQVVRSKRKKTATIKVESGLVSIVCPSSTDIEKLEQVIKAKRKWIIEKLAIHNQSQPPSDRKFVSGEEIPYLGRHYRLKVIKGPYQRAKLLKGRLVVQLPKGSETPAMVRNAIVRWYWELAYKKLLVKSQRYAKLLNIDAPDIDIKDFKSRWGSCTPKGEVQFNWRIIMAPNRVCDYVVIHELCHLIQHDHSQKFWALVKRLDPDYAEKKEWLKLNAEKLHWA